MIQQDTNRWVGISMATFLSVAVALVFTVPAALIIGVVGGAYAGWAHFDRAPDPDLSLSRTVSDDTPRLDDTITVTVTVRNDGEFLPDLRIVDGVPDAVEVVDGSPRLATALRSGKEATFTYEIEAVRGDHTFGDATVVARDAAGSVEVKSEVGDDASFRCVPTLTALPSFPLRAQSARRVGRLSTDESGAGVEFHATREYRTGDPLSRVDWKRLARTGDLATVEFREERAGTVAVVVDTRESAYVARPDDDSAVEYGVRAAGSVAATLLDTGDRVGLASYGPDMTWLAPSLGRDHRQRFRRTLATDDAFDPTPPDARFFSESTFQRILKRLPSDAQVVCCTPLCDDGIVRFLRRIDAHGHSVTVVSPDVTGAASTGDQLSRARRRTRIRGLRQAGVRVVDWPIDEPLAATVARAERGWRA